VPNSQPLPPGYAHAETGIMRGPEGHRVTPITEG
jgi:hypothetical protein